MPVKSPFFVSEEFISPNQCEKLVKDFSLVIPSRMESGEPFAYERYLPKETEAQILERTVDMNAVINSYYNVSVNSYSVKFQQFWENAKSPAMPISLPGWKYNRKKWTKLSGIDLVGVVWLKDYNDSVPLDPRYEVYGGKLEFPSFDFSFVPARGTLVLFPAVPNFSHAISHVLYGSLQQLVFGITLDKPLEYSAEQFGGTFRDWF